jgi:2'-hydroxyisoflavone reductase
VDVLIIGGTGFLGRYLVEAALEEGHRPTLFNRGLSEPQLFPEVERIEGDREVDLAAPRGRSWESGREPAAGLRPEREQELLDAWHGATL